MSRYPLGCVMKIPFERRRQFDAQIEATPTPISDLFDPRIQAVTGRGYLFKPGRVLTVAFAGGDKALRDDIAGWAKTWETYANIVFDFEADGNNATYREWSHEDTIKNGDIRIGFESTAENYGYWSAIGNDIDNVADGEPFYPANIPTMNFEDLRAHPFDKQRAFVLHEFGHAIGFLHEHQAPGECDSEFRWDDDEGYNPGPLDEAVGYGVDSAGRFPGIYTVMENPPYEWSHQQVDDNMRSLEPSYAYVRSDFDTKSIMKYYYEAWMYVHGENSHCYSPHENTVLSEMDKKAAAEAYPFDDTAIGKIKLEQHKNVEIYAQSTSLSTKELNTIKRVID